MDLLAYVGLSRRERRESLKYFYRVVIERIPDVILFPGKRYFSLVTYPHAVLKFNTREAEIRTGTANSKDARIALG